MTAPCPYCSAPLSPATTRCDECDLSVEWANNAVIARHPFIRPGEALAYCDAARVPLPGRSLLSERLADGTTVEAGPQGALISVVPGRVFEAHEPRMRMRDVCVRASFIALDPGVTVACVGRAEAIDVAKVKYVLELDPVAARFAIKRGFSSPEVASFTQLRPWAPCPQAAPLGHPNILELRLQGPTLEARVNDQHVATLHDPVLGIGAFGLRVSSQATQAGAAATVRRAIVQWFETREVVA